MDYEDEDGHALSIHFQADQQPRPAPSISSGAVQNSPEWNRASSQRPAKMPISMGVTTIQPNTPIWPRRRATFGSPSRSQDRWRVARSLAALTSGSSCGAVTTAPGAGGDVR